MLPLHNAVCDRPHRRCVAPGVSRGHPARSAAGQAQPVHIIIFLQVFLDVISGDQCKLLVILCFYL